MVGWLHVIITIIISKFAKLPTVVYCHVAIVVNVYCITIII